MSEGKDGGSYATVGKYRIGRTLGEGMQGKVKLGIDMETDEEVALKFFRFSEGRDSSSARHDLKDAQREVALLLRVNHPNIINIRGAQWEVQYPKKNGTTVDAAMVVLDYASGGLIFDFMLHTGKFSEVLARTFFKQLISALDHCQAQGISHRDIKPENIFLGPDFSLKLGDFGLARLHEKNNAEGLTTYVGTRAYMPPEVLRLKYSRGSYNGEKVDVWTAAVVLFIMLCGAPPMEKADADDWYFHKISTANWRLFWMAHERVAEFSDGAKSIIQACFNPDADARITLKELLDHPWMQKKTLSSRQMRSEMMRRKRDVDRVLAQQRRKKQSSQGRAMDIDEMQEHVYRDMSTEELQLAALDPRAGAAHGVNTLYAQMPQSGAPSSIPAAKVLREMVINGLSALGATTDEEATNMSKCRIVVTVPPRAATEEETKAAGVDATSEELPPPAAQISAAGAGTTPIEVVAQVLTIDGDDSKFAVQLSRRKGGSIVDMFRVLEALREKLGPLLCDDQTLAVDEAAAAEAADEEDEDEEDETL